jgi:hypothetical protein
METYIVQYEYTLEKIAEKKLGNTKRWYEIAQLNNIESPLTQNTPNSISIEAEI